MKILEESIKIIIDNLSKILQHNNLAQGNSGRPRRPGLSRCPISLTDPHSLFGSSDLLSLGERKPSNAVSAALACWAWWMRTLFGSKLQSYSCACALLFSRTLFLTFQNKRFVMNFHQPYPFFCLVFFSLWYICYCRGGLGISDFGTSSHAPLNDIPRVKWHDFSSLSSPWWDRFYGMESQHEMHLVVCDVWLNAIHVCVFLVILLGAFQPKKIWNTLVKHPALVFHLSQVLAAYLFLI